VVPVVAVSGDVGELPGLEGASAGRTAPAVGPLSADQQPATKADLYAAVDALRGDVRELLDEVRKLIRQADRLVGEAERAKGAHPGTFDDDQW
ncbi:hypothetical protein BN1232_03532, partial [Mycobacterium numidiamassiliense]